jgi:deoxyribose-phosphate aldolase
VKIAGGVKTNKDCAVYMELARGIRKDWNAIRPDLFRIGASSLIDVLLKDLGSKGASLAPYEQTPS